MELEELKASWNAFDKRLAESDIVNLRMVKEMIAQKTRRAFDRIRSESAHPGRGIPLCLHEYAHQHHLVRDCGDDIGDRTLSPYQETQPTVEVQS